MLSLHSSLGNEAKKKKIVELFIVFRFFFGDSDLRLMTLLGALTLNLQNQERGVGFSLILSGVVIFEETSVCNSIHLVVLKTKNTQKKHPNFRRLRPCSDCSHHHCNMISVDAQLSPVHQYKAADRGRLLRRKFALPAAQRDQPCDCDAEHGDNDDNSFGRHGAHPAIRSL